MPRCPSCAREVADRAAFCGYCGAAIGGPAPGVAEPHSGAQPGPNYWICPRCHVENIADTQFCRSCGAVPAAPTPAATVVIPSPFALPARWRCATCNEINDPDAQFCYYCGVPSGSASAAGAAAAASRPYTPGGSSGGQGYPPPAAASPHAGRSWGGLLVLAAALIAVAAVGAAVAFVLLHDRSGAPSGDRTDQVPSSASPSPPPSPSPSPSPNPVPKAKNVTYLASAEASSRNDPRQGNDYDASNLLDNSIRTCWAEDAYEYGYGEWVKFDFEKPVVLRSMKVMPGYGKGWDHANGVDRWLSNGRLKSVRLDFSSGSPKTVTFTDQAARYWKTIWLPNVQTRWIKMTILSAYPHTSGWGDHAAEDTSVSEVEFFGWLESEAP